MRDSLVKLCALFVCTFAVACQDDAQPVTSSNNPTKTCTTGKCDGTASEAFLTQLKGRDEATARWLAANAKEDGIIEGDYRTILEGIATELGCDAASEQTFSILLSRQQHFPRNIVTLCSDNPRKASEFFLSTQSDVGDLSDVDGRNIKIAAWDQTAGKYNLYEIRPAQEGEPMKVAVEPAKCATCHAPQGQMAQYAPQFVPIMNELTDPWTLWNAEPEFRSHRFDELIPDTIKDAPVYSEMTQKERLGSAADFETIMRSSFDRVARARLDVRKDPASLDGTLQLLQPLFCDESANYASENHGSDQIQHNALVDASLANLFVELDGYQWDFDFVQEARLRFATPTSSEARVEVIPVRSDMAVSMEKSLVSRRVLTASQILRVRAIDWKKPVFSDARCAIFEKGRVTLQREGIEGMESYETVADLAPVVLDLMLAKAGYTKSDDATSLIAVENADDEDFIKAKKEGDLSSYELTQEAFGGQIQAYLDTFKEEGARTLLEPERQRRGCIAIALPFSPEIPNLSCE